MEVVRAADKEIRRINFVLWGLAEGRRELLIISVYLFGVLRCVTHICLHHRSEIGVTMN